MNTFPRLVLFGFFLCVFVYFCFLLLFIVLKKIYTIIKLRYKTYKWRKWYKNR